MIGLRFRIKSVGVLRCLWLGFWLALAIVMHMPVPDRLREPIGESDKLLHAMAYFVLTLLGGRVLLAGPTPPRIIRVLFWAGIYLAYAALDELLQPLSGRTGSFPDWVADATGIVLGTSILATQTSEFQGDEDPE